MFLFLCETQTAKVVYLVIELRTGFGSVEEWGTWQERNKPRIPSWVNSIINEVKTRGLTEPFTYRHYLPSEIHVDPARLQVSMTAGHTNSRKRADLIALESAVSALPRPRQKRPKILGAEGITPTAQILRWSFPYYLPTEYLPTQTEKDNHYPIQHLDLMDINLPSNNFDIFFSAHVLEHVPDVSSAIKQIVRVIKPGGVLVSTFPFDPMRLETITKARISNSGEVEHLMEPEYHGNPVRAGDGSLVFQLPGWDLIDMCYQAGLTDAKMMMIASTKYGVAAAGYLGIFAIVARKPEQSEAETPKLPAPISYFGPFL